ncbi:MAG: thiosulfate oxidation carrier protein SoxY [Marinosulfonomonas sp.]|nr:MAG: thiosulfate oxidation carrier protein SoxY [Marinosulfonomonas sp.]
MELTRRNALAIGAGAFAATVLPFQAFAAADKAIMAFTGGADVGTGGVTLTSPEIAENGNTVPIAVDAPGAVSILLLATGNPVPDVATANFGPLAAAQRVSLRIRLAGSQDIVAVAKMADGSFVKTSNTIKVTIGGCGG